MRLVKFLCVSSVILLHTCRCCRACCQAKSDGIAKKPLLLRTLIMCRRSRASLSRGKRRPIVTLPVLPVIDPNYAPGASVVPPSRLSRDSSEEKSLHAAAANLRRVTLRRALRQLAVIAAVARLSSIIIITFMVQKDINNSTWG